MNAACIIITNNKKPVITELACRSVQREGLPLFIVQTVGQQYSYGHSLFVDDSESKFIGKSRNIGAIVATQNLDVDYLIFMDDDMVLSQGFHNRFRLFTEILSDDPPELYHCRCMLPSGDRYWDYASIQPHCLQPYHAIRPNWYISGNFWVMRSDVWRSHQWDDKLEIYASLRDKSLPNEDVELSCRLARAGVSPSFDRCNMVWHADNNYVRDGIRSLNLQRNCGRYTNEFSHVMHELSTLPVN